MIYVQISYAYLRVAVLRPLRVAAVDLQAAHTVGERCDILLEIKAIQEKWLEAPLKRHIRTDCLGKARSQLGRHHYLLPYATPRLLPRHTESASAVVQME